MTNIVMNINLEYSFSERGLKIHKLKNILLSSHIMKCLMSIITNIVKNNTIYLFIDNLRQPFVIVYTNQDTKKIFHYSIYYQSLDLFIVNWGVIAMKLYLKMEFMKLLYVNVLQEVLQLKNYQLYIYYTFKISFTFFGMVTTHQNSYINYWMYFSTVECSNLIINTRMGSISR